MQEDSNWKSRSTTYNLSEQIDDMTEGVESQWLRANVDFKHPVVISTKCLKEKLQALWKTAQDIVRKRVKKAVVSSFEAKLDKLLDITKCKCEIQTCKEIGCAG